MSGEAAKTVSTPKDPNDEKTQGKESSCDDSTQKRGEIIVPNVPDGFIQKVAEELYGLRVLKCQQLNGYDDKNYHIHVSPTSSNPHLTSVSPEGYVMKVMNSLDTQRPAIFFAQIEFMQHLRSHGIPTQEPVPSVQGENVIFYPFPSSKGEGDIMTHAVCLRTFIPGSILHDVTLTRDLCYKIGVFQASMTKALEDFHHPFYETFDCLWSLNNVPKVTEFVHVITDVTDRRVVDDVIEQFSNKVLPRREEIRTGYIHGDPNEHNILVQQRKSSSTSAARNDEDEYIIAGILDFQEASCTHPLYDLAMIIAYVSLLAKTFDPLEVGGHILAGYTSVMDLPAVERSLLREVMAGRLVQSLVLGAYNYTLYPDNEYLLTTAKRGWHVLHMLWDTPADTLHALWDRIQHSYIDQKQSDAVVSE